MKTLPPETTDDELDPFPEDSPCDPATLGEMIRKGDAEALDRVTRCYGRRLMQVGRARCQNEADAGDAVQDALLAATEHMDGYQGRGLLGAWLSKMVVNACHRMRRGRKNDATAHDPEAVLTSAEPDPEVELMRARFSERFGQALLTLEPDHRALFLMASVEGWKAPEIAQALGLTPGAVRTRLTRTRKALQAALGEDFEDWL